MTPRARWSGSAATTAVLAIALAAILGGGAWVVLRYAIPSKPAAEGGASPWDAAKRREWAGRLLSEGLNDEAIEVYEDLIRNGDLDATQIASASVSIAKLHLEKQRWEKALASAYRAQTLAPEAQKAEIGRLVIQCLERLGRSSDARFALKKSTATAGADVKGGEGTEVLAEAGAISVTRRDVDLAIKRLPGSAAAHFAEKDARRQLVQSLLAERVLFEKAKNLDLAKDPEVRAALDDAERQILVRKHVQDEIASRVKIDPADVKLFFEARKADYRDPARAKVRHVAVADAAKAAEVRAALAAGTSFEDAAAKFSEDPETAKQGGLVAEEVRENGYHPKFANVAEVLAAVEKTEPGAVATDLIQAGGKVHLIAVVSKSPGRDRGFDEVKDAVERDYRRQKEQAALDEMLKDALEKAGAKIHEERIGGEEKPASSDSRPERRR